DEDSSTRPTSRGPSLVGRRRRNKKWDDDIGPGGPVSQSAIFPSRSPLSPSPVEEKQPPPHDRHNTDSTLAGDSLKGKETEKSTTPEDDSDGRNGQHRESAPHIDVYEEGHHMIFENEQGDVLDEQPSPGYAREHPSTQPEESQQQQAQAESQPSRPGPM